MKKLLIGLMIAGTMGMVGCNTVTRQFGGTSSVDLPKGQKLINITWKDSDMWYLTRPMEASDKEETYEFQESSNFGMLEGKVIVREHK